MSVPQSNRNRSKMEFFDFLYKIEEKIIKFVLADFGATHTYRSLRIFCFRAKMNEEDSKVLEEIKQKYGIDTIASYPEYILSYFREAILVDCREVMNLISIAYTMYPTTVFEFNTRKKYQVKAIGICYDMKHELQMCIRLFDSPHIEKFTDIIEDIDKEIEYIRQWKKDCNKIRKGCYDNDTQKQIASEERVRNRNTKRLPDNQFLERIINTAGVCTQLNKKTMIDNMNNTTIDVDGYGRLRSSLYIPAVYFVSPFDENKIVGFGF